jgi:hypothetical protein
MGNVDRKVLAICLALVALTATGAILYFANDWWLSGVVSVSLVCWLAGVLAAIYDRPDRRPVLICALAASFLYVVLTMGPWFREHVGPWLLTTRGLVALERHVFSREASADLYVVSQQIPNARFYAGSGWGTTVDITGSGVVDNVFNVPTATFLTPVNLGPSPLVMIGHWLIGWIAAGLGGWAAAWILRRRMLYERNDLAVTTAHSEIEDTA